MNSTAVSGAGNRNVRPLDVRLPRLPVLTSYLDTSYTKFKLAPGFYCSVRFEAWTEFDAKVAETKSKLERISGGVRDDVERELSRLRRKIIPTPRTDDPEEREALRRLCSLSDESQNERDARGEQSRNATVGGHGATGSTHSVSNTDAANADEEISLQQAEQTGTTAYSNTSSCITVNHAVFEVVETLVREIRNQRSLFMLPQLPLPSELGKQYKHLLTPKEFCTLIPDLGLTRASDRPCKQLPICSFELKGPLREFWEVSEHHKTTRRHTKKQRRDGDISEESEEAEATSNYEFTQVVKVALVRRKENPYAYSAEALAAFYNDMFRDPSLMARTYSNAYLFHFLPVAQALSQALLSESGCCVLYNHQEAVAFEVYAPKSKHGSNTKDHLKKQDGPVHTPGIRSKKEEDAAILVRVSRAFSCDEEPGNLCALVALANYSCELVEKDKDKKGEVRELFSMVTHVYVDWKLGGKMGNLLQSNSTPGVTGSGSANARQGTENTRTARQSAPTSGSIGTESAYCEMLDSSSSGSGDDVMKSTTGSDEAFTRALADIVMTNEGVIGTGASAVVLGGYYKDLHVAVKSWNGFSREGIDCLLNEVEVFKLLMERCADVLGIGVPYLTLYRSIPAEDVTLVVDYVGHAVECKADGTLILYQGECGVRLGQADKEEICQAAISSLRKLHGSGILHGDISLRNLRAQRKAGVTEKPCWDAWWIDLGLSRECSSRLEMEVELEQCGRLFPGVNPGLIISAE